MTPPPNRSLVVYCLYLAGGATARVHTEDIALKCWELYPDSFSWTKYPQYPDKDIVRVALTDARKAKYGAFLSGRVEGPSSGKGEPEGWILTEAGLTWVREYANTLDGNSAAKAERKNHRQLLLRRVRDLKAAPLYRTFASSPSAFAPSIGELAGFLRCRVDATAVVWNRRLTELRRVGIESGDSEVERFVQSCQEAYVGQS
jgi:hypothetical protein